MRKSMLQSTFARLRDHVITGFIFIMPVLITVAVIMKFWSHLLKLGATSSKLLRVDTVLGPSGDAVMAVLSFCSSAWSRASWCESRS